MKNKPLGISSAEREAKSSLEKSYWVDARGRSRAALVSAGDLHNYLHGCGDSGPDMAEALYHQAEAIRYAMASALAIRGARFDEKRLANLKKKKKKR